MFLHLFSRCLQKSFNCLDGKCSKNFNIAFQRLKPLQILTSFEFMVTQQFYLWFSNVFINDIPNMKKYFWMGSQSAEHTKSIFRQQRTSERKTRFFYQSNHSYCFILLLFRLNVFETRPNISLKSTQTLDGQAGFANQT